MNSNGGLYDGHFTLEFEKKTKKQKKVCVIVLMLMFIVAKDFYVVSVWTLKKICYTVLNNRLSHNYTISSVTTV